MKSVDILCPHCGSKDLTPREPSEVDFDCDLEIPFVCKSCGYSGQLNVCRRDGKVKILME